MSEWKVLGDAKAGVVMKDGVTYPYAVEEGQVRVRLPFVVDRERLQELLTEQGWAVDPDGVELDREAWGPVHDAEGYYPCYVWPDRERGETILAYPPRDYHATAEGTADKPVLAYDPVFGTKALQELKQWLGVLEQAAQAPRLR